MGDHRIKPLTGNEDCIRFCRALLNDMRALEVMLQEGLFEKGVQRIGAEQELCLIGPDFSPVMTGPNILSRIDEPAYTSELARFNLEINLAPQELTGDCFRQINTDLERLLVKGQSVAAGLDSRIILTGILPTIERRHLQPQFMTPSQRYQILSEKMMEIRGDTFNIQLEGVDELITSLDSVLFEACNTSFQLHLQIDSDEFVPQHNWSQLIAGPVLAIAANSPLLLGRELWMETRVALFKQSLDTRNPKNQLRDKASRVNFGNDWIYHSVTDILKENIARFPLILGADINEDSMQVLNEGGIPNLRALWLHNGTTYTWNRPCYGVGNGIPHLRIECRYLPAGPSVPDEMANFVFWAGLMKGMPARYRNLPERLDFRVAKANFLRAARTGMATSLDWDGQLWSAPKLVNEVLLPIAEQGLQNAGVSAESIDYYLGVIQDRCIRQQSGSRWMVRNFHRLRKDFGRGMAANLITEAILEYQQSRLPVHQWEDIRPAGVYPRPFASLHAGDVMSTDLFTVKEEDPIVLTGRIMHWRNIRHLPVENKLGELVGILSRRQIEAWSEAGNDPFQMLNKIMIKDPICAPPETPMTDIQTLMATHRIGSVPIVIDRRLVGMITDTDLNRLLAENGKKVENKGEDGP